VLDLARGQVGGGLTVWGPGRGLGQSRPEGLAERVDDRLRCILTERCRSNRPCLLDANFPDHALDLRQLVGRHAQLPHTQAEQKHRVERLATHCSADTHIETAGRGGGHDHGDQAKHGRIGRAVEIGD
jgi:hypothetical protein